MTDNLPPLPVPYGQGFTDEQMRNYANAAIDAALAARGAVPAGWADEIIGLIEEYGSERATGAYHGEHFCHQKPADLLKKIRELLTAAPQQVAQPSEPAYDAEKERPAVNDFAHWLNARRGLQVSMVFHEIVQCYRAVFDALDPKVAQAKPEQPLTDEETAIDLLAEVFDAYENGTPCYEEPDEHGGFVGNAFILSDETFHACADLLNRRRPVAAAPQKPKD